jgi:hypothetical protein
MQARSLGVDKGILNTYQWVDHFVRLRSPAVSTEIDSFGGRVKILSWPDHRFVLVVVFLCNCYGWDPAARCLGLRFVCPWLFLLAYMASSYKIDARISTLARNRWGAHAWNAAVFLATFFYLLVLVIITIVPYWAWVTDSVDRIVWFFLTVFVGLFVAMVLFVNIREWMEAQIKSDSEEERTLKEVKRHWHSMSVYSLIILWTSELHFRALAICLFLLAPSFWRYSQLRWKCTCSLYEYVAQATN